jgi:hypothetical protein
LVHVVLAVIALMFLVGAVVFGHIAAWYWLNRSMLASAGILGGAGRGGADLVLAVIFGFLAGRSAPSAVELEAASVRRQALEGIGDTISLARLAVRLLQVLHRMKRRPHG